MNAPASAPPRIPIVAWCLALPGVLCLIVGLAVVLGDLSALHPLLGDTGTGVALVVSAIALLGSAAFPIVLARLADRDRPS